MAATDTDWPVTSATPLSVRVPAAGRLEILTLSSAFAGLPSASVKPKSAAEKVYAVSSSVVTVLFVPAGASFTAVTSTVIARGVASRLMPPFAVPPLSRTWNVNDA